MCVFRNIFCYCVCLVIWHVTVGSEVLRHFQPCVTLLRHGPPSPPPHIDVAKHRTNYECCTLGGDAVFQESASKKKNPHPTHNKMY